MRVEKAIPAARQAVRTLQRQGHRVGLVPTMGALHAGHLSLVAAANELCDRVVVTVFVNPTQFGPNEDLDAYPRTLDADLAACRDAGVALVFTPETGSMYRPDAATTVHVSGLTETLCGPRRPGHFDGVATVVAKLFHILPADAAFFGEKDFQQLQVIRRMVRDLDMAIDVVGCPTVREPDGLAMSSRNAYLPPRERQQAVSLSRALFAGSRQVEAGERHAASLLAGMRKTIEAAGPAEIEYLSIVDSATLADLDVIDRPARACLAVRIGATRLIDNVALQPPTAAGPAA